MFPFHAEKRNVRPGEWIANPHGRVARLQRPKVFEHAHN
jgi:hypothetical protein